MNFSILGAICFEYLLGLCVVVELIHQPFFRMKMIPDLLKLVGLNGRLKASFKEIDGIDTKKTSSLSEMKLGLHEGS